MSEIIETGSGEQFLSRVKTAFTEYAAHKKPLDEQQKESFLWFRQQQGEFRHSGEREAKSEGRPLARSGYIFNAVINKHADAMDAYPDINVLPREEGDEQEAKTLTEILPFVLEQAGFRETYAKAWWDKAIGGAGVYGVFWNSALSGGLGEIEIKRVDIKKLVWQPYIGDIQDSRYLFYTYYMDKEEFVSLYGREKLAEASAHPEAADETHDSTRQAVITDCYYKKDGAVHLLKYSGSAILERTEGQGGGGLYEHGLYPFILDVLYPLEDSPAGFGIVDVVKNAQAYIDKLDDCISTNALTSGKLRYLVRKDGKISKHSLLDMSQAVVETEGSLNDESFRQIQAKPISSFVMAHRQNIINELKEVVGNRDFQQGGVSGGVTAASAITVLQQAGDKLSRDMIQASYGMYKKIIYMCIELIRQFYDAPRKFRITGADSEARYKAYDNTGLKAQFTGDEADIEYAVMTGMAPSEFREMTYRRPEFDLSLTVERSNPFNRAQQNQTVIQLYQMGFFAPQNAEQALTALEFMNFDGKDAMLERISEKREQARQEAMRQTQREQVQQMPRQGVMSPSMPGGDMVELTPQLIDTVNKRVEKLKAGQNQNQMGGI